MRHRATPRSRPQKLGTKRYFCQCFVYPNGHSLLSKSSYYRHLEFLRECELLVYESENNSGDEDGSQLSFDDSDVNASIQPEEDIVASGIDSEDDITSESGGEDEVPDINDLLGNYKILLHC